MDGQEDLEFYGQRPWRPGKLSAEPPDPLKEKEAIQALQYKEKTSVNHSVSCLKHKIILELNLWYYSVVDHLIAWKCYFPGKDLQMPSHETSVG